MISRFVSRCALCICLCASSTLASGQTANTSATLKSEAIRLPSGRSVTADVGRVEVPENRSKKASRAIEVAFIRVRNPETKSGAVNFVLAGGPGDSGIDLVRGLVRQGGEDLFKLIPGDIVGIDQRGVGSSRPNLESKARYNFPLDDPGTPERYLKTMLATCSRVAAEFREQGVDLTGYNTQESADDVEAIRKYLGYEQMTLWGRSYGSHLALAVLRRYGTRVERVVICGPEGPDHTLKLPSHTQASLERVGRLVETSSAYRGQITDFTGLVKEVLDSLDRQPVFANVRHPLTGAPLRVGISKFDVQLMTARALGNSRYIQSLPAVFVAMRDGDYTHAARWLVMYRSTAGVESAMKHLMDSSSFASPTRLRRIEHESRECLLGNAINFPYPDIRIAWGSPDLGDEYRGRVRSEVPVLFICGDLDPRTPVENAKELMRDLPNSRLVVVEHASHDLNFFGSPGIRHAVGRFLRGQELRETRLSQPAPPF